MRWIRGATSLLLTLGTIGCSGGEQGGGTLVGDAYLVLDTGEEINLVGTPVRLVEEEAGIDTVLARICVERDGELARLRETGDLSDIAGASDRAWQERERILSARTRRAVTTDAAAQFAMDSIPPGSYRLWADTTANGVRWSWLHPIRVRAGDSARVNLSNANTDDDPFRCG